MAIFKDQATKLLLNVTKTVILTGSDRIDNRRDSFLPQNLKKLAHFRFDVARPCLFGYLH